MRLDSGSSRLLDVITSYSIHYTKLYDEPVALGQPQGLAFGFFQPLDHQQVRVVHHAPECLVRQAAIQSDSDPMLFVEVVTRRHGGVELTPEQRLLGLGLEGKAERVFV